MPCRHVLLDGSHQIHRLQQRLLCQYSRQRHLPRLPSGLRLQPSNEKPLPAGFLLPTGHSPPTAVPSRLLLPHACRSLLLQHHPRRVLQPHRPDQRHVVPASPLLPKIRCSHTMHTRLLLPTGEHTAHPVPRKRMVLPTRKQPAHALSSRRLLADGRPIRLRNVQSGHLHSSKAADCLPELRPRLLLPRQLDSLPRLPPRHSTAAGGSSSLSTLPT